MRIQVYSAVMLGCLALAGFAGLIERQRELAHSIVRLKAQSLDSDGFGRWQLLAAEARERAQFYETAISERHLLKGLVVNRGVAAAEARSVCDSLLFSSLRYVALLKLGMIDQAEHAWQNIVKQSYQNGRWLRHPDCRRKASSRDMIVGLMAALSQEPARHRLQFARLLKIVARTGGSVDDGPFYVSRLSPGISELLRHMAQVRGWRDQDMPSPVRAGFATVEFDTWIAEPGYRAHLNGLTLWIELELLDRHPELEIRSLGGLMDELTPAWGTTFADQRRAFAAHELYRLDPDNLFFEWLRLKTAGALSYSAKARLLGKLLAMPQFPATRLPQDCDRRADYMWQRSSAEYTPGPNCSESFAGVDFLWMASLLTDDSDRRMLTGTD